MSPLLKGQGLDAGQAKDAITIRKTMGKAHGPLRPTVHRQWLLVRVHSIRLAFVCAKPLLSSFRVAAGLDDALCDGVGKQALHSMLQGADATSHDPVSGGIVIHVLSQSFL